MRFAIIEAEAPGAIGTVEYTDPNITDWSSGGLAIVMLGGNNLSESETGSICLGFVDHNGNARAIGSQGVTGRTANCLCRHHPANSPGAGFVLGTGISGANLYWARVESSAALTNGVRLNWVEVDGVAGRELKVIVVLIEGLSGCKVDTAAPGNAAGFPVEAVLMMTRNAAFTAFGSTPAADAHIGFGGGVDDGALKQASAVVAWDNVASPTVAHGFARDNAYAVNLTGNPPSTSAVEAITSYDADGFNVAASTVAPCWVALATSRTAREFGVALETLSGTGSQHFTGIDLGAGLVMGFICGVDALNSVQSGSARSFAGYFVTDGVSTKSFGISHKEGVTAANPTPITEGYSRFTDDGIDIPSHTGGIAFAATVEELTRQGLRLNITTGLTGTMILFGFGAPPGAGALGAERAPGVRAVQGRARRVITSGIHRAARYGRFLRTLLRSREMQQRARRRPSPEPAPLIEHVQSDPSLVNGDNAMAGSTKGADAQAGSVRGDSA